MPSVMYAVTTVRPASPGTGWSTARNLPKRRAKKIAEFVSFQSELRVLAPDEAARLTGLTRIDTPVAGALEQIPSCGRARRP
jgi:hypothetical protein